MRESEIRGNVKRCRGRGENGGRRKWREEEDGRGRGRGRGGREIVCEGE